jgi:predicted DsbA family dithiol-disulfide isomerase
MDNKAIVAYSGLESVSVNISYIYIYIDHVGMFCYAQDARLEKNTKSGAPQELQNISKQ